MTLEQWIMKVNKGHPTKIEVMISPLLQGLGKPTKRIQLRHFFSKNHYTPQNFSRLEHNNL